MNLYDLGKICDINTSQIQADKTEAMITDMISHYTRHPEELLRTAAHLKYVHYNPQPGAVLLLKVLWYLNHGEVKDSLNINLAC